MSIRTLARTMRDDDGMSIVEVIVAFMVFMVIAVGMAGSLVSMTKFTYDADNRETATQLAAQEVDRIQNISNAFNVFSDTTGAPSTINGVTYTVRSSVGWVSSSGSSGACGTGGGNLQFKRVNVWVTWPGMVASNPVRADTVIAPESRINDPAYGTILINTYGADGTGRSAVNVTVTPQGGGAAAITETIDPTDLDGCTYVLKVVPGNYRISVSKTGAIDSFQITSPYVDKVVSAGSTTTAAFQYDQAGIFTLKYAANATTTPLLPSSLQTTYFNGSATFPSTSTASPIQLHPFPVGYQAIAGNVATCAPSDPANWPATSTQFAGERVPAAAAQPGGSATLLIPMGLTTLTTGGQGTIVAEQLGATANGGPACATPVTYSFSGTYANNTTVTLALPYGTWRISTLRNGIYTAVKNVTIVGGVIGGVDEVTGGLIGGLLGGGTATANVVTLDPRKTKP